VNQFDTPSDIVLHGPRWSLAARSPAPAIIVPDGRAPPVRRTLAHTGDQKTPSRPGRSVRPSADRSLEGPPVQTIERACSTVPRVLAPAMPPQARRRWQITANRQTLILVAVSLVASWGFRHWPDIPSQCSIPTQQNAYPNKTPAQQNAYPTKISAAGPRWRTGRCALTRSGCRGSGIGLECWCRGGHRTNTPRIPA
jgi:hypothetical protein